MRPNHSSHEKGQGKAPAERIIKDSVADARANLAKYLTFYSTKRPHTALNGNTPDSAYFKKPQPIPVAA